MKDPDYQIHELAEKAGVSVRTIRFYIDEGLLPAPAVRGRYSVYTEDYLERLELIQRLKERFLPLKEIRARLEGLGPEEVRAALAQERLQGPPAQPAPENKPARSRALDYINQVLESQPRSAAGKGSRVVREMGPAPSPREEVWERIQLAPGIELHIQRPVEASTRHRLQELIEYARHLLNM